MQLSNTVINFLGDSITEGAGASCLSNRYTDVLERVYGLKKANNYGISGSRIARQQVMTADACDRDFCMRLDDLDPAADGVVVFGGTNDYGHGQAPIGTPTDREPSTFYGACHTMMDGLLTRFAGKPVAILTPLHRDNEHDPRGENNFKPSPVAPLSVYRDILMEVAAWYALPVLDLYATSGIQPANPVIHKQLLPDGLHPNDEGHALLARRIGEFLKML